MELPEKGKEVIVFCSDGTKTIAFRCACKNKKNALNGVVLLPVVH